MLALRDNRWLEKITRLFCLVSNRYFINDENLIHKWFLKVFSKDFV